MARTSASKVERVIKESPAGAELEAIAVAPASPESPSTPEIVEPEPRSETPEPPPINDPAAVQSQSDQSFSTQKIDPQKPDPQKPDTQDIDNCLNSLKTLLSTVEKLQKVRQEVGDIKSLLVRMLDGEVMAGEDLEQLKGGVTGLFRLVRAYSDHQVALTNAQPARSLLDQVLKGTDPSRD